MRALILSMLAAAAAVVGVQSQAPQGFIVNKSAGKAYKVMYQAQQWVQARDNCENIGAFLAVPKSQDEFQFLQRLIRGMYYPHITGTQYKLLVWLGIYNFEDGSTWRNIDGEDINETGFHKWSSHRVINNLSNQPKEPQCAGMDAHNTGLREYWCNLRQPYICQIHVTTFAPDNSDIGRHARFIFD